MNQPDQPADRVLGLDNIALDLPVASIGSRALAAALDYLILTVLTFVALLGSLFGLAWLEVSGAWVLAVVLLLLFLLQWGYFAFSEMITGGRTLGKKALQLRVIGRGGGGAGIGQLLARNLVRLLDIVVGLPLIAADPLARRLGDRIAGTLVVHERRPERTLLLGRIPERWSGREVAVAESVLGRIGELEEHRGRHLARRLMLVVERDAPEMAAEVATYTDPVMALQRALLVEERWS